jgi:hypothetical protein
LKGTEIFGVLRTTTKAVIFIAWALILLVHPIQAVCQDDSYTDRNQIDPAPIKLSRVMGIAKDPQGVAIPGVRVLLFTDPDHKLVATTTTDEKGFFALEQVSQGRYRLVTKSAFCSANVPIKVQRSGNKQLHLHMVVGGIDACSYGDLK